MAAPTTKVFFDVAIGRRAVGRLKFELFNDVLPITAENFRSLATGETGLGYWLRPRWYKNASIHRVVPGFMCQGGDFNYGNGYMGESIYGQSFRDEKFAYRHSKRGVLSMANKGQRHTNNSQFFITFAPCPWLDGSHVVFGHVTEGMEVLDAIEAIGTEGGRPRRRIWIHNCGEEDRLLAREEWLEAEAAANSAAGEQSTEEERLALAIKAAEGGEEAESVPRPEPYPHINEISPVPDEIWRRAKARRDNML
eukprot:TRINITY_DN15237_c0_g1_i1.p1 TRINITY_DN15237_c0_g1~~TRINITY_DN15237_c0_g1_i1.p1  ORF type:complete len:265 (+),score=54.79 TRINITY_DN15237_c0_g1_i1:40-795(+)